MARLEQRVCHRRRTRLRDRVGEGPAVTTTDTWLLHRLCGAFVTDAASGGSGGVGIDYGNFPIPRGLNFGFRVGF